MINGKSKSMKIGKNTTLDKLGRITLLKEIRDLFMMDEGDTLSYYTDDGRIYVQKDTKSYGEYDFENEMIEERVKTYEKTMRMLNGSEFDDWEFENGNSNNDIELINPHEEIEKEELRRQFMDDIALREKNKKEQKNRY
jgi:hypothetical protein